MSENTDIELLLRRTRLLLEEGRYDAALAVIKGIQPANENQQHQKEYFLGWYYILHRRWNEAAEHLLPLHQSNYLEEFERQGNFTDPARLAIYLLHLGDVAVNICRYEDASRHYLECLKVLTKRRLKHPSIRVKARLGLGLTCITAGMFGEAIQHYKEALRVCKGDESFEDLPHIYYGLCDAYRNLAKFDEAKAWGDRALQLYASKSNHVLEGRIRSLLGRICFLEGDLRGASDHYTEALGIATIYNNQGLAMASLTGLADVRLGKELFEEARRYCQLAREVVPRTKDAHIIGMTYLVSGKVAQEEASRARGERKRELLEEAISWFEKAEGYLVSTQVNTLLAELNGRWAQTLEQLDCHREAIGRWKLAYRVMSKNADVG